MFVNKDLLPLNPWVKSISICSGNIFSRDVTIDKITQYESQLKVACKTGYTFQCGMIVYIYIYNNLIFIPAKVHPLTKVAGKVEIRLILGEIRLFNMWLTFVIHLLSVRELAAYTSLWKSSLIFYSQKKRGIGDVKFTSLYICKFHIHL